MGMNDFGENFLTEIAAIHHATRTVPTKRTPTEKQIRKAIILSDCQGAIKTVNDCWVNEEVKTVAGWTLVWDFFKTIK